MKNKNSIFRILLPLLLLGILTSAPTETVNAQSTVEFLMKRFGRKSKIKKIGKKLYGNGEKPPLGNYQIEKGIEVIGYEPSWLLKEEEFKNYYFNLLTGLVVGEYDINPKDGLPRNSQLFYNHLTTKVKYSKGVKTDIVGFSRKVTPRMKILFSLTYQNDFGREQDRQLWYRRVLKDPKVAAVVTDSLKNHFSRLNEMYSIPDNEMGIVVNFQELASNNVKALGNLLKELRDGLGEDFLIYLKVSPVIENGAYLTDKVIETLEENDVVDLYIINAAGFETQAQRPGPIANLYGDEDSPSIDSTVNYYLNNGVSKEKMLVEFSYSGVAWEKIGDSPYRLRPDNTYVTTDEILTQMPRGVEPKLIYDKDTSYTAYRVQEQGKETMYFYDSPLSFDTKFHYVRDTMSLKGISLYGLGYNSRKLKERDLNWYAMAASFSKQKSSWGWMVASYLFAFMPLGFLFSVARYWEVRNVLAKARYKKYWTRFLIAFIITTLIAIIVMDVVWFLPRDTVGLIIGAVIVGFFVAYMILRRYLNKVRKYAKYAGAK